MLRTAVSRSTASVLSRRLLPSATTYYRAARFNSTKSSPDMTIEAKQAINAAKERNNDLQRDWDAPVLTYEQIKPKTQSPSPDAYLIDVREPNEVILGSIPSSVNMPLSTLSSDLKLDDIAFKEKFKFEKPMAHQEVTFYCRSGKRSASASDIAKRNGYTNIFNYSGSWLDWVARETERDHD